MKIGDKCNLSCRLIFVAACFCAILSVRAQGLPEGEGLPVVIVACTQCHGLDRLTDIKLSAVQWENALYDMMARGAIVEEKDLLSVREYLIENFATDRE